MLLRLRKEDSGKVCIFSDEKLFVADTLINCCNSRYLTSLPVSEVDGTIWGSPFSKAPAKVMVLGVVASDGRNCPIIFILDGEKVTANSYQALLRRHMMPWPSTHISAGELCVPAGRRACEHRLCTHRLCTHRQFDAEVP